MHHMYLEMHVMRLSRHLVALQGCSETALSPSTASS